MIDFFANRAIRFYNNLMYKHHLLVTDIDGTLLDHQGRLPEANIAALQRCAKQGLTIALATGRNITVTRPIASALVEALGTEIYLVLQDGSLLLQFPSMRVLQHHNLGLSAAQVACDFFQAEAQPVLLFDPLPHGDRLALREYGPLSAGLARYLQYKPDQYSHQSLDEPLTIEPSKIVTLDHQTRIERLYGKLRDLLQNVRLLRTEAVRIEAWFLEVGPVQASKRQAISALLDHLGYDWSEVMAFGDAENDLEMIQTAGHGVAMGNASDRVKQAANQVIGSNMDDGLAVFLDSIFGA